MASLNALSGSGSNPSFVMSSCRLLLSRSRMTTFSPKSVGHTETRKSISRPLPNFSLILPSCGRRRSAMSSSALILRRLVKAAFSFMRGLHRLEEHAVHAVADAEVLLVRLDVDVGGALLDGVGEDQVHELDDRSVGGRLLQVDDVLAGLVIVLDRDLVLVEAFHHLVV